IAFSRTGWSVQGSDGEWDAATILYPSGRLFLHRDRQKESKTQEAIERKVENDYYDRRRE
ncbi:MAG TPA: hypothetical protein VGK23_10240, partial [Methanomassiliicoccales archaeon]